MSRDVERAGMGKVLCEIAARLCHAMDILPVMLREEQTGRWQLSLGSESFVSSLVVCVEARLERILREAAAPRAPCLGIVDVLRASLLAFEDIFFGTALVWEQACRERHIVRSVSCAISILRRELSGRGRAGARAPPARRRAHELVGLDSLLSLVYKIAEHAPSAPARTHEAADLELVLVDAERMLVEALEACPAEDDALASKAIVVLSSIHGRQGFRPAPGPLAPDAERHPGRAADDDPARTGALIPALRTALLSGQPAMMTASLGILRSLCSAGDRVNLPTAAPEILSTLFDLVRIGTARDHPRVIALAFGVLRPLCSHPALAEEFRYGLGPVLRLVREMDAREGDLWAEAAALLEAILRSDTLLPCFRGDLRAGALDALSHTMQMAAASLDGEDAAGVHLLVASSVERLLLVRGSAADGPGHGAAEAAVRVARALAAAVYEFHLHRPHLGTECFDRVNGLLLGACASIVAAPAPGGGGLGDGEVAWIVAGTVVPAVRRALLAGDTGAVRCVSASMALISAAVRACRGGPELGRGMLARGWVSLALDWIGRTAAPRDSEAAEAWRLIFQLVASDAEVSPGAAALLGEQPRALPSLGDVHGAIDLLGGRDAAGLTDAHAAFVAKVAVLDLLSAAIRHGDDLGTVLDGEAAGAAVLSFVGSHSERLAEMPEAVPAVLHLVWWFSRARSSRERPGGGGGGDEVLADFLRRCAPCSFVRVRPGTVQSSVVLTQRRVPEAAGRLVSAWSCRCWRWPRTLESMRRDLAEASEDGSGDDRARGRPPALRFSDVVLSVVGDGGLEPLAASVVGEMGARGLTPPAMRGLQLLFAGVKHVLVPRSRGAAGGADGPLGLSEGLLTEAVEALLAACGRVWEADAPPAPSARTMHAACILFELAGVLLDRRVSECRRRGDGSGVRRGKRCLYRSVDEVDGIVARCVDLADRIRQPPSAGRAPGAATLAGAIAGELDRAAKSFSCLLMLTLLSGAIEAGPAGPEVSMLPKCKERLLRSRDFEEPLPCVRLHLAADARGSPAPPPSSMGLLYLVLLLECADRPRWVVAELVGCVAALNALMRTSERGDLAVRLLSVQLLAELVVESMAARRPEDGPTELWWRISESLSLLTSACFSGEPTVRFHAMLAMARVLRSCGGADRLEASASSGPWFVAVVRSALQTRMAAGDVRRPPERPYLTALAKVALNNFAAALHAWEGRRGEFGAFLRACGEPALRALRDNAASCRSDASELLLRLLGPGGARGAPAADGRPVQSASDQARHVRVFGLLEVYGSLW